MSIHSLLFIAFLISLFVGTTKLCIGLGISFAVLTLLIAIFETYNKG